MDGYTGDVYIDPDQEQLDRLRELYQANGRPKGRKSSATKMAGSSISSVCRPPISARSTRWEMSRVSAAPARRAPGPAVYPRGLAAGN